MIDCVVPCHPKDEAALAACIGSVRKHLLDVDQIFVVSKGNLHDGSNWIPQDSFPFSLADIETRLPGHDGAARWYLQQTLKLSVSPFMTKQRWLQIDADIVWQKPARFTDDAGRALFSTYCDPHWHAPYFAHMKRLIPGIVPTGSQSLIAHHVLYDRDILDSLFREVETHHARPFWQAYLDCIDPAFVTKSGAAENELYSHYALWRFPDRCRVRPLRFRELKRGESDPSLDFASYQSWNI